MVKIRLARSGAKKRPFYPIVVTDSRSQRDGNAIEQIGFFNPIATGGEERLRLDMEKADKWISQGAQPTDRVKNLMKEARMGAQAAADKRAAKAQATQAKAAAAKQTQAETADASDDNAAAEQGE